MTQQPQAPITYGYIYSHMRNHQRITTLITLSPGNDFIDGTPCDSVADAAERADGMGVMLLDSSEVHDMVKQRREAANGVQNLVAAVSIYEAAADALPAELPEPLEVLRAGAFVHVTPLYGKRPYFGWVKSIDGDRVTVSHWSFGYRCEHGIEEVRLHLSAAAAAL